MICIHPHRLYNFTPSFFFRSGVSVVGRDYYGVFPLKGKPLNVREATHAQIMKNEEIKNVVEILGLKFGVTYDETNVKTLRYGHLMIMADQDHDGSHIKGLVINFIHREFHYQNKYMHLLLNALIFTLLFAPSCKQTFGQVYWTCLDFFNNSLLQS